MRSASMTALALATWTSAAIAAPMHSSNPWFDPSAFPAEDRDEDEENDETPKRGEEDVPLTPVQVEARSLFGQGVAQHAEGRTDVAAQLYERALKNDPDYFEPMLALGSLCLGQKKWKSAITWLERAAGVEPFEMTVILGLAQAHEQLGELDLAESYLDHIQRYAPQTPELLPARARLFVKREKWDEARTLLERGMRKQPNDPELADLLLDVYQERKLFDLAIPLARRFHEMEPGDHSARFRFVSLLLQAKRAPEATKLLEDLVRQHPDQDGARRTLIQIYEHQVPDPDRARLHRTVLEKRAEESRRNGGGR